MVTKPRLDALAEGMLKVCVVPDELILKSAPVVPVAKVWVVPLRPFNDVIPVAGGLAHVPSPLQNVELDALVPLFRLVTGRLPVTSAVKDTAPKLGAPPAFPCKTVVVVPSDPRVLTAVVLPPRTNWFIVNVPAAVTFPDPAGVAHVPSPRQKVELLADVPELRFVTGKFPVTSALRLTALNDGTPAAFPCSTVVVVPRLPRV